MHNRPVCGVAFKSALFGAIKSAQGEGRGRIARVPPLAAFANGGLVWPWAWVSQEPTHAPSQIGAPWLDRFRGDGVGAIRRQHTSHQRITHIRPSSEDGVVD